MRMCGHAHHDDMLYLGKDPQPSWDYPPPADRATPTASATRSGRRAIRSPVRRAARGRGRHRRRRARAVKREAEALVEREARAVIDAPWPRAATPGPGVRGRAAARAHRSARSGVAADRIDAGSGAAGRSSPGPPFDREGHARFSKASCSGVRDALRADPRVFVYGEDVGGAYGNAFLLLRPLLEEFGDRISTRRSPKARCSASASARRSPASGRSARCSSTTSSPPASTSS